MTAPVVGVVRLAEQGFGTSATSSSSAPVTGSTLLVFSYCSFAITLNTPTDNKGNTFSPVTGTSQNYAGSTIKGQWFQCVNAAGGAGYQHTQTVSANDTFGSYLIEIQNAELVSSLDAAVTAFNNDVASPFTVASGTPTAQDICYICGIGTNGGGTNAHVESTGFTLQLEQQNGASFLSSALATKIVANGAAVTPSWTRTGSTDVGVWIIGVKGLSPSAPKTPYKFIDWQGQYDWKPQRWDFPLGVDLLLDDFTYDTAATPGAISGTATITFAQTGDLKGAGALAGSAALTFAQTGVLRGAGALAGTATITFGQSGDLKGAGALAGTATVTFAQTGNLLGAGALAGSTAITFGSSADLKATGALSGSATIVFSQTGDLTNGAAGSISGTATVTFGQSGDLRGDGVLIGSSSFTFGQVGDLKGAGTLAGAAAIVFSQTGDLTAAASGALSGTASITFAATGDLTSLTPADAPTRGGGGLFYHYEEHRRRRERELEEIEERERLTREIEDETDREIAELLRLQELKDAKLAEAARLQRLADMFAGNTAPEIPPRVREAMERAAAIRSFAMLQRMQAEILRMYQEEEAAVLAALLLDDD